MTTMQALVYVKPRRLEWHEIPTPKLETGLDALVRPLAVARCDLDVKIAAGGYRAPGPFQMGHEIAGEVIDVGDEVTTVKPGDRVIVPFQIHCGTCDHCRRGWTNSCQTLPAAAAFGLGTGRDRDFGGGLSDCVRVPFADAMLVPLPDGISPELGCGLSDNVADGFRTVAGPLARFPGAPVLVVGGPAQSVGLYAALSALALGSERVVYADSADHRLGLAKAAGAQVRPVAVDYADDLGELFPIVADATASASGLQFAFRHAGPCAHVTGVFAETTELKLAPSYIRGLTYELSRVQSRAVLPQVVECVCSGALDPDRLKPNVLQFSDAAEAMLDPAVKLIFVAPG